MVAVNYGAGLQHMLPQSVQDRVDKTVDNGELFLFLYLAAVVVGTVVIMKAFK